MNKIPQKPDEIFEEFTLNLKSIFANNLESIILFGSAARGEYKFKKSDINFLVVLKDNSPSELAGYNIIQKKWLKKNVSIPLFLTEEYILSSLDTFPIEFLDISSAYKIIYGKDILENINIKNSDLRYQIERELKGKLLHLRLEFLRTELNKKKIQDLVSISFHTFIPIFKAILKITEDEKSNREESIIAKISELANLNYNFFVKILSISKGELTIKDNEIKDLFDKYVEEMDKIVFFVDKLSERSFS